jgi:hypothetical protein
MTMANEQCYKATFLASLLRRLTPWKYLDIQSVTLEPRNRPIGQ